MADMPEPRGFRSLLAAAQIPADANDGAPPRSLVALKRKRGRAE